MNKQLSKLVVTLLTASLAPAVFAATLNDLKIASLPGDKVELKLIFDEPVMEPKGYTIERPARIALDLPGVTSQLTSKTREIGMGNARSLSVIEAQDRTRLIVNLNSLSGYTTRAEGKHLYVIIGDQSQLGSRTAPQGVQPSVQAGQSPTSFTERKHAVSGPGINNLDFQRGEQGEGNVVISLTDPNLISDIKDEGGKIRVTFPRASLPETLRVRLDVKDFATPVQFVNASQSSDSVSILIEPTGHYDYLAYQSDDKLTISVKPLTREEKEKRIAESFAYTGEKLSLNFQDIDVRSVLQLIADFTELNLVASDTVQGNITLRLQNVPWDQALDLVLKTKGLAQRKVGNVLLVAPAEEIAARERQEMEAQRQVAELAPLRRELIQVNYAKAADIAALFQSVSAGQTEERGTVTVDDRTNAIIAYQTQERLDELRRIVTQLDIPVRQVMIEARIVEANVDYEKELGVKWGGSRTGSSTNYNINDAFVDLGANSASSGIGIGFIGGKTRLDLELSAMEKSGNGEVVSQPKIVTSDKETAKIMKGSEVPYQEASSSGATSTSFKEAALSLEVTPQITPDNRIMMEVKVTKDAPDFQKAVNGVPPIDKNEVNAKVLVADGETIVIGGVFQNVRKESVEKVPVLGDIPGIKNLFRRTMKQDDKTELLVFITPRIMNNQSISLNR
ncbi:type IV pilus secretin PilQ family protein [Thiopseudomonas alkaliphila]|uniref:Type IV pilus secretin PilQ family protein n=1 Tax=Thiopseudomonas alkaliphila TaxID=1697053 RepID=A0AAW7DP13_9GAMM|nr:type IV pilus secretin PilQ family protein [Thiopseudomonas alkaliphila]MDM1695895.1 type IV pilus secretin PilQ family protein [Thiopseudomonas alkaliphila]